MILVVKLVAIFSLTVAIIYILLQSIHGAFYPHLYVDVFVFHARSLYFWEHMNLAQLGHNEYQPGAILFFILLGGGAFLIDNSLDTFRWVLFGANVLLIILTAWLLHKMDRTAGVILLSVLIIFLGPILLFRFDLLVIFLLTLAFFLWEKGKLEFAMMILSFGVLVKVYPIIFLPYLLWLAYRKHKLLYAGYLFSVFLSSLIIYFFLYTLVFQISFRDTFISYNFHNLKSVATESVWASLIYFIHIVRGIPLPAMESDFGINAISRLELFPSLSFYNYFWLLPMMLLNILYFRWKKTVHGIDYKFVVLNMLVFLVFSKVLSNQYLGWFLFLVPLISIKYLLRKIWIFNILLIILTTILHTFIYPLNYTQWLGILNQKQPDVILTSSMLLSSLILFILLVSISYDVFRKNSD